MEEPFWLELHNIESNAEYYADIYSGIFEHLNTDDGSFYEFKDVEEMAIWFYENVFIDVDLCELTDILKILIMSE